MKEGDVVYFENKRILIIGGTGTIGTSLVGYLLKENPQIIKILSRDEYKQHMMKEAFDYHEKLHFIIGDAREYDSLIEAMDRIDYVIHVAAMKRVEVCESNPFEAVRTNVMGTYNVMKAATQQHVKKVVFTSSDKAISPTNAYGATKLLAERMIAATEKNKESSTIFASVRFGNVMGSRGSVIPLFIEQIKNNQRINVTNKNMTRFMMTLEQATELTLKALREAQGGEVFVLKMPVIQLGLLAEVLIEEIAKQNRLREDGIEVKVTGLRTGEKMYEELMTMDESKTALELQDMYIIPSLSNNNKAYEGAKKADIRTYSSSSQKALDREGLRALLKKAGFI